MFLLTASHFSVIVIGVELTHRELRLR